MTRVEQFYLMLIETDKITVDVRGIVINTKTGNQLGSLHRGKNWIVVAQADANKKLVYILLHRLVWLAHKGSIPDKMLIVPIDKNFQNACLDNLQMISKSMSVSTNRVSRIARHVSPKVKVERVTKPKLEKVKKIKPIKVTKTQQEIRDTNPNIKLTMMAVIEMRKKYKDGSSILPLATEYHVSKATVFAAVTGRTWKDCEEAPATIRIVVKKVKEIKPKRVVVPKIVVKTKPTAAFPKKIVAPPVVVREPTKPCSSTKQAPKYPGRLAWINGWN